MTLLLVKPEVIGSCMYFKIKYNLELLSHLTYIIIKKLLRNMFGEQPCDEFVLFSAFSTCLFIFFTIFIVLTVFPIFVPIFKFVLPLHPSKNLL